MENTQVVCERILNVKRNHSLTLMPMIEEMMTSVHWSPNELTKIVCAKGPGSYTGIRLAVTTAKTLAYTLGIELVGVSSLEVLAGNVLGFNGLIVPIFDARRKNVYAGIYRSEDNQLLSVVAESHTPLSSLLENLKVHNEPILFIGDVANFSSEISNALPNAVVNENANWNIPHGAVLAQLGANKPSVNPHMFLPEYLKRVEAEEIWLKKMGNTITGQEAYVEKV